MTNAAETFSGVLGTSGRYTGYMRRLFLYALAATPIVIASPVTASPQGQIQDKKVGFIYTVPPGWRVKGASPDMGMKYPIAVTTPYNGFTPNIVVVDEVYSGTSDEYADWLTRTFQGQSSTSTVISKNPFKTNAGVLGTKLVVRNTMGTISARQVYYIFPTKAGFILNFTATSLVEQGFKHDKALDNSMRKIVFDK